jgi:hypothetical protein
MIKQAQLVLLVALACLAPLASAGTLVVNANTTDPAPRAAWEDVVARFQGDNPDIQVQFNIYDSESYKKSIRNWLTGSPPDVVFWYAGHRMRQFVTPGLLEDLSDLYVTGVKESIFAAISSPPPASPSRRRTGRSFSPPAGSSRQRASSRSRSARATCGPLPRGSTTSTCGSMGSRFTWT